MPGTRARDQYIFSVTSQPALFMVSFLINPVKVNACNWPISRSNGTVHTWVYICGLFGADNCRPSPILMYSSVHVCQDRGLEKSHLVFGFFVLIASISQVILLPICISSFLNCLFVSIA